MLTSERVCGERHGNIKRFLIIFLKEPRPGAVKTRLAQAIGPAHAAHLYHLLATEVLRRTAPHDGEYRRLLFSSPPSARRRMTSWSPNEKWISQGPGDLGRRMSRAFDQAFALGAARVVIVGSDSPFVSRRTVLAAMRALERRDLVIAPAPDGGYGLLGLRASCSALFRGIPWSTPAVFAQTLARALSLGLRVTRLAPIADIDTLADVRKNWRRLRPLLAHHLELHAALRLTLRHRPPDIQ